MEIITLQEFITLITSEIEKDEGSKKNLINDLIHRTEESFRDQILNEMRDWFQFAIAHYGKTLICNDIPSWVEALIAHWKSRFASEIENRDVKKN